MTATQHPTDELKKRRSHHKRKHGGDDTSKIDTTDKNKSTRSRHYEEYDKKMAAYGKKMTAYGNNMVEYGVNTMKDPNADIGKKFGIALLIIFIIAVIVGLVFLFGCCIAYTIKFIKGSIDSANANGLNPIQWIKDPIGSLTNFFSYVTSSWQNLGNAVLDGVFFYLLFESGGASAMLALTTKII